MVSKNNEVSIFDFDFFKPTKQDYYSVAALLNGTLPGTDREVTITRLCEVAAVNGCLDVRAALGTLAGLTPCDVSAFTEAVGRPLDQELGHVGLGAILRIATDAASRGDDERFTLIAASVGYYPPTLLFEENIVGWPI